MIIVKKNVETRAKRNKLSTVPTPKTHLTVKKRQTFSLIIPSSNYCPIPKRNIVCVIAIISFVMKSQELNLATLKYSILTYHDKIHNQ